MALLDMMPVELWVMTCHRWLDMRDLVSFSATCRLARHMVRHHCSDVIAPCFLLPKHVWLAVGHMMEVEDLARLSATSRAMRRWVKLFCTRHLPPASRQGILMIQRHGRVQLWAVLKEGALSVYMEPTERNRLVRIPLRSNISLRNTSDGCSIELAKFRWVYTYQVEDHEDKVEWMRAIYLNIMQA